MIMKLKLIRHQSSDEGTFGVIVSTADRTCWHTAELPWRGNERGKSCIPIGSYETEWITRENGGKAVWLPHVPGRDEILVHAGNWAGDEDKGFRSDSDGCILIGRRIDLLQWKQSDSGDTRLQRGTLDSAATLDLFHDYTAGKPFLLDIVWVEGVKPRLTPPENTRYLQKQ